jgi:hypothetical protein
MDWNCSSWRFFWNLKKILQEKFNGCIIYCQKNMVLGDRIRVKPPKGGGTKLQGLKRFFSARPASCRVCIGFFRKSYPLAGVTFYSLFTR